jgi:molybdopterin converting factor small subunit
MAITVEVTYDMAKALGGVRRFDVADARTVADVIRHTRERFGAEGEAFEKLTRVAAVAVNGVLANHKQGIRTQLADGDTVTFLKAAAGG